VAASRPAATGDPIGRRLHPAAPPRPLPLPPRRPHPDRHAGIRHSERDREKESDGPAVQLNRGGLGGWPGVSNGRGATMEFGENRVFEVARGVFIRNGVDNCVWADLGDGVVTIDALEDPGMAPVIQSDIARTVGKPMKWLINTHWHGDHIACNPAWAAAGATVIAHESVGAATKEHNGQPNITFHDRYTLQGGERQVSLQWRGRADHRCD